eukprot:5878602-Prymnesium_polylepis.2
MFEHVPAPARRAGCGHGRWHMLPDCAGALLRLARPHCAAAHRLRGLPHCPDERRVRRRAAQRALRLRPYTTWSIMLRLYPAR